jgi:hypothetical protein
MSLNKSHIRKDIQSGKTAWSRFSFNVKHLLNEKEARSDIIHSYVNLYVEGIRASAYIVGHIVALIIPLAFIALITAFLITK